MNSCLKKAMDMVRAQKRASQIKISRHFTDFLADRLVQSGTEPTLLSFSDRLARLLDCDLGFIPGEIVSAFMQSCCTNDAGAVLQFIRDYPRVVAMVASLKNDSDYSDALEQIEISPVGEMGCAKPTRDPQIELVVECESPLAHGDDSKAGNATIFRRCQVLSCSGHVLTLPFYAGNALRGQMRDILADHFVKALGLSPDRTNPPVALWFFHALYAGGALEENSAQAKALAAKLGGNGAVKAEGIHELRNMIPHLSALGYALGNRIISGRLNVMDLRPRCAGWGTGATPDAALMEWTYLTRREDHEGHANDNHHGMIANTECLRMGTVLDGGVDISAHATEIEASAIGRGLELLAEHGWIGAESRRGMGRVKIDVFNAPSGADYEQYLSVNIETIRDYLGEIGALR